MSGGPFGSLEAGEGLGVVSYELVGTFTGPGAPLGGCWIARRQP